MTNPYPITPRQLDLDKLSGSSLKKTGSYPNIQLDVNFSGSPIAISGSTINNPGNSIYPSPMNHTHEVESSSNPGSNSMLVKTNSEGGITLQKVGIGISGSPTYNFEVDTDLTFVGSQAISTTSDVLTLSPASDLDLNPGGTARVRTTNGVIIQSDNYVSQTTGWGINYGGSGDFRYLTSDELHAKAFIADLEQSLAGGQIISKSVAPIYEDFIVPDYSTSSNLVVESFKGFDTFKVFEDADIVRIRTFSRTSGSLSISDCWGEVYWISTDTTNKTQTYEFTRSYNPLGGTTGSGTIVSKGTLAIDYGYSTNGVIESNAIDGNMGENSPYTQVTSWTTHPQSGTEVKTRMGNLKGIFNVSNEFGFFAGNGYSVSGSYLRASNASVEAHNIPINLYDGSNLTISLSPTAPSFAMGSTLPSGFSTGAGLWMGKDSGTYKFRVGDPSGKILQWDGTNLYLKSTSTNYLKADGTGLDFYANSVKRIGISSAGVLTINDSGGNAVMTFNASSGAEITKKLTLSGTSSALSIGSTPPTSSTVGTGIWLDRTGFYSLNSNVYQVKINATDGKLYAGGGAVRLDSDGIRIKAGTYTAEEPGDLGGTGAIKWESYSSTAEMGGLIQYRSGNTGEDASALYLKTGELSMKVGDIMSNSLTYISLYGKAWTTRTITMFADEIEIAFGQFLLAGGTVSTPGLAKGDDKNTGIYFPAADQLGFTTGGSIELLITNTYARFYDDLYADQGIYVGRQVAPGAGNVAYTGVLKSYKNSTEYTGYIFVPLSTEAKHSTWDGNARTTSGPTKIDLSAVFGIPAGVKAVSVRVLARDSGSFGAGIWYLGIGPSSAEPYAVSCYPPGSDIIVESDGICPCDANGDVYFKLASSGSGTLDAWIRIWGYFI